MEGEVTEPELAYLQHVCLNPDGWHLSKEPFQRLLGSELGLPLWSLAKTSCAPSKNSLGPTDAPEAVALPIGGRRNSRPLLGTLLWNDPRYLGWRKRIVF